MPASAERLPQPGRLPGTRRASGPWRGDGAGLTHRIPFSGACSSACFIQRLVWGLWRAGQASRGHRVGGALLSYSSCREVGEVVKDGRSGSRLLGGCSVRRPAVVGRTLPERLGADHVCPSAACPACSHPGPAVLFHLGLSMLSSFRPSHSLTSGETSLKLVTSHLSPQHCVSPGWTVLMRKVPAEHPGDKACVFSPHPTTPHGPGAHGCSVSEWTNGEALPAAHTHPSAHSVAGGGRSGQEHVTIKLVFTKRCCLYQNI